MSVSLSVLITYYDEGSLLRECIESLIVGDDQPDEILVYDDASPTVPAREVVGDEMPVRVVRGDENVGPSRGRNRLLKHTSTEYVHYHDADDLFHLDWCSRVRSALDTDAENRPDIIFTEITSEREGAVAAERVVGFDRLIAGANLLQFCIRHPILPACGTYRRSLLESIGGYRTDLWQAEDYDLHIRLALQSPAYACIPEPMATIRLRPGGRSRKNHHEVAQSVVKIAQSLRDRLPSDYHPDLAERVALAGSSLYQSGRRDEAKRAFRLAEDLGPPQEYTGKHRLHKLIARTLGGYAAEQVSAAYRTLFPKGLRARLPR